MEAKPMADADKFEKLKEKYNQLKQANTVLKKGLLEKQEESANKDAAIKEKETAIRQQLEEIDHLQFQNGRMSKQMGTLTDQVETLQKSKPSTGLNGLNVGGFFSGKQQQEALLNAEAEIKVLRDELVTKIEENEDLHMQMYESKQGFEQEVERIREESAHTVNDLALKGTDLENERAKASQLLSDKKNMTQRIQSLEQELETAKSSASSTQGKLEDERREAKTQIDSLNAQLKRWVPFDEAAYAPWNLWNCTSRHGREAQWRREAMKQFRSSVVEACKLSCGVLEIWGKTFSTGNDGESSKRLRMRNKMAEMAEKLAAIVGETIPGLVTALAQAQMRPSAMWERHFKQCVKTMLQAQRKWVTYQSLLLLHESSGSRSAPQAQNFVDCLWRLHRCVTILFKNMRLFFCTSLLSTKSGSSMHFMQARDALRVGPSKEKLAVDFLIGQKPLQERASNRLSHRGSGTGLHGMIGSESSSPGILGTPSADSAKNDVERHLSASSTQMMERMRAAVRDVSQCWEGISRCLSSWATSQKSSAEAGPDDGAAVVSLLESLHGLCACMTDRLLPGVDGLLTDVPSSVNAAVRDGRSTMLGLVSQVEMIVASSPNTRNASASVCLNRYISSAGARLLEAAECIGFDESSQTQVFARQLATEKARLSSEVRQQMKRLLEVSSEKTVLADELRSLQDNHALLRSNLQVLKETAVQRRDDDASGLSPPDLLCTERPGGNDLVLTSRQRALLESLSITTQESSNMRQHGYFVDTVSLTTGEAALAAGPPDIDAYESWEMAVRKVYEQHARNLQVQVRVADDKAKELYVHVQENMDLLKEQEDSKQKLRGDLASKQAQLTNTLEDIASTRRNYDSQLAMLTEHICELSAKLGDKDASVATLHTHKILCGHCGMWNAMGKLLAPETGGKCNTCKEKVLNAS